MARPASPWAPPALPPQADRRRLSLEAQKEQGPRGGPRVHDQGSSHPVQPWDHQAAWAAQARVGVPPFHGPHLPARPASSSQNCLSSWASVPPQQSKALTVPGWKANGLCTESDLMCRRRRCSGWDASPAPPTPPRAQDAGWQGHQHCWLPRRSRHLEAVDGHWTRPDPHKRPQHGLSHGGKGLTQVCRG